MRYRARRKRLLIEQAVAERLLAERDVRDENLRAQYLDDPRYELSEESGAEGREGLLPPGREGAWVPEFWRAGVALEKGGLSPVAETEYGFHVLRLEAKEVVRFDRGSVAYEAASMWEDIPAATDRWLESLADEVEVDEAAARSWQGGTAGDSVILARWEGGGLNVVDLEQHLLSLDRRAWQAARGDLGRATQEVVAAGARTQAVQEARRLGARDEMASIAPLLRAAFPFHLESNR